MVTSAGRVRTGSKNSHTSTELRDRTITTPHALISSHVSTLTRAWLDLVYTLCTASPGDLLLFTSEKFCEAPLYNSGICCS